MATKQARDIKPGDIIGRDTVARVEGGTTFRDGYPCRGVRVTFTNGLGRVYVAYDVVEIHHADTVGGGL